MLADRDPELAGGRRIRRQVAQSRSLNLMPWQFPPYCASLADLDQPPGDVSGRHESAALLQRLLRANLSPFEPNPIAALQREAEQRRATK